MAGALPWRVLLADDDPKICSMINSILKGGPYAVTTCNDAETALVHLRRDPPFDVLICDFMLPGISGIDFISQVRNNEQYAKTPIVMISGHGNYAMPDRAMNAGADVFLSKPFTLSQLRLAVSKLLPAAVASAGRTA